MSWEVATSQDAKVTPAEHGEVAKLELSGSQECTSVLRPGWVKVDPTRSLPTFTTSRPQVTPGRKPAGIRQCATDELLRWSQDLHRFPPYQYRDQHCVQNAAGELRIPDTAERELMLGFPLNYTQVCLPKNQRKGDSYNDARLTLLGNSWSVPVVAWLLSQLFGRLGFIPLLTPQEVLDALLPGKSCTAQGRLVRLPLQHPRDLTEDVSSELAFKLGNLISIKGEDILLTTPTTQLIKHHRLRATVPAKLWRWSVVTGWKWTLGREHINSLELRAILTALRWRVEHKHHLNTRVIHMTDSLVCLHSLTRGRSSSRKLRRTMSRINALILASNLQPVWAYVHTDQNPADKPSRWGRRVKTKYRNAK